MKLSFHMFKMTSDLGQSYYLVPKIYKTKKRSKKLKPGEKTQELVTQGYKGSYTSVRDNIVRRLQFGGRKTLAEASSKTPAITTSRQAAFLFLRHPEKLRVQEQQTVIALHHMNPEVNRAYDLVRQFAQMLLTHTGEHLDT